MHKVYAALARVPVFRGMRHEAVELERLGSLTNASYKVTVNGIVYVLRLPGRGTSEYIDRMAEEHNARIAAAAGVNAEVLFFDASDGLLLSRFVEGVTLNEERLNRDPGTLARVALSLRRVHRFGRAFRLRFDAFARIAGYLALLRKLRMPLPESFGEVRQWSETIQQAINSSPMPLAPCHNDTWPRNFLDAGGHVYLIDWEYSGMNDPMWDLADLSVEAGFGPEQDRIMMKTYHGGNVSPALYARLELYKAMSDLHWAVWGLVQHASGNPAEDFQAYAFERLEYGKMRISGPSFGRHLVTVRNGHRSNIPRFHYWTDPKRKVSTDGISRKETYPTGFTPSSSPYGTAASPQS